MPKELKNTEIKNVLIYYFSGTGNARFAANKIAEEVKMHNKVASVKNIANKNQEFSQLNKKDIIGFCYPTHGFNTPPIVLNFIRKFPKGKGKIFLLNTRAGMKIGKFHTPGISGIATLLPALILVLKGYRIIGLRPLDMPSNWISLHPGLNKNTTNFIIDRCSRTLEKFTKNILNGKSIFAGLIWLPIDIMLIPISFLYYLYGRYALAKTFFANYNCDMCGICIKQCPVNAIKEVDNRPFWTTKCESCMKCMNNCPQRAIETSHGYTFLIWWLGFSFIPPILLKLFLKYHLIEESFYLKYQYILINIAELIIGTLLIIYGYKLMHQLLRIKFFNKIITFTSLTHFKFWNRYKLKHRK